MFPLFLFARRILLYGDDITDLYVVRAFIISVAGAGEGWERDGDVLSRGFLLKTREREHVRTVGSSTRKDHPSRLSLIVTFIAAFVHSLFSSRDLSIVILSFKFGTKGKKNNRPRKIYLFSWFSSFLLRLMLMRNTSDEHFPCTFHHEWRVCPTLGRFTFTR